MAVTHTQFKCVVYFDEAPAQKAVQAVLKNVFRIIEGIELPSLHEVNLYFPPGLTKEQTLRLGNHLQHAIKRHRLRASIGIASTQTVARAAARSKAFKVTLVNPGEEARFLQRLPIDSIPAFGKNTARVLKGLGLTRVGQLQAIPEHNFVSLFGPSGRQISLLSFGSDVRKQKTAPVFHMAPLSKSERFRDFLQRSFKPLSVVR